MAVSHISLIPAKPDYAEEFLRWREDPTTIEYNPLRVASVEELRVRLSKSGVDLSDLESTKEFLWFVAEGKSLVGQVSIQNVNAAMLTAEVAFTVAPEARSRGIASAAVLALTDLVFKASTIRRLTALVHDGNIASKQVLTKVGYKQEGLLREHFLVNGKPTDEAYFAILKAEFQP
ncbi:MAG: N-acetyltransferase [Proteobacteria bacterium]|nr:MAG: N-acetyltransferase [Pseudomonadota bacterium]